MSKSMSEFHAQCISKQELELENVKATFSSPDIFNKSIESQA